MVLEIAEIRVQPGQGDAFEEAIQRALRTVMARAKGASNPSVHRCIESPDRFILQITWDTLEDHTVGFRQGPLFPQWRAIIGQYFASPPLVEHFDLAVPSR